MDLLLRVAAAAICALLSCLLLRRTNPELAAVVSITAVVLILLASIGLSAGLRELKDTLRERFGLSDTMTQPVLKCVAVGIVSRLTADLCRDASQTAAASAVELAGALCALGIVMPLLLTMLKMVGDYL